MIAEFTVKKAKNGDNDDLLQEGVIGLLKAVSAFDIYHHCSFKSSYVRYLY
ncbi:MAG: hypothetical protein MJH09_10145 [Cetobacterium sp.]|nr:hypothetical protein [Cetobacterium sp.]